jgi:hypothetical protein
MEDFTLENKRDEFISLLRKRITWYQDRVRNAGGNSDIINLGMQISRVEIAISLLEQENWTDEDWVNYNSGVE